MNGIVPVTSGQLQVPIVPEALVRAGLTRRIRVRLVLIRFVLPLFVRQVALLTSPSRSVSPVFIVLSFLWFTG